jgi:hypothetical protein
MYIYIYIYIYIWATGLKFWVATGTSTRITGVRRFRSAAGRRLGPAGAVVHPPSVERGEPADRPPSRQRLYALISIYIKWTEK